LESSVSSFPSNNAKVNIKIGVFFSVIFYEPAAWCLNKKGKTEWGHSRRGYWGECLSQRERK